MTTIPFQARPGIPDSVTVGRSGILCDRCLLLMAMPRTLCVVFHDGQVELAPGVWREPTPGVMIAMAARIYCEAAR